MHHWLQQNEVNSDCLLAFLGQVAPKVFEFRFELRSTVPTVLIPEKQKHIFNTNDRDGVF